MTQLQQAGVKLAAGVLVMISVLALIWIFMLWGSETASPPPEVLSLQHLAEAATKQYMESGAPESLSKANDAFGRLNDARRGSREFWMNVGQFLLLNLLLPVLTSILGYIFGSMRADRSDS